MMTIDGMQQYRKKPVVIEAVPVTELLAEASRQWTALPACIRDAYDQGNVFFANDHIILKTSAGDMRAERGDMIIRGIRGELYPCKADDFAATYYPVED